MKKANATSIIGVIFLIMGLIFISVGVGTFTTDNERKNEGIQVEAVISEIVNTGSVMGVWVDYEYDGEIYEGIPLNSYSSSMYEGERIEITINEANPTEITSSIDMTIFLYIFGGIGLLFAIIGACLLVSVIRRNMKIKKLIADGYCIEAKIQSIDFGSVRINHRPTYVIRCMYRNPEDGMIYSFKSDNLLHDPSGFINGDTIRVYVDKNNFKNNYVDINCFTENYIEC